MEREDVSQDLYQKVDQATGLCSDRGGCAGSHKQPFEGGGGKTMASLKTRFFNLARSVGVGSALAAALWLATAIASPAQTFNSLVSFDGSNGENPAYMSLIQGEDGNYYGTTRNRSTVFMLTPAGNLTTLYGFSGDNQGYYPDAGLVLATDGNFYGTTYAGGYHTAGTVFMITPSGVLTTLYTFCSRGGEYCTDGYDPQAGLVQATNGSLYGTVTFGGAYGSGTVFKITAGKLRTLHNFNGNNPVDGGNPYATLIQATDGNLYGTTNVGGADGAGTIFRMNTAGKLTVLYSFTGGSDGAQPVAGLVQATDGNFYGTVPYGGSNGVGTVFKMTSSGVLTTLYSFSGSDGAEPVAGLAQGTDGNFYGTTTSGGADGYGTVFQITPGGTLTTLHNFNSADGASPWGGLFQATNGTFYGTTETGGVSNNGTVFSLNMGLGAFVSLRTATGTVGQTVGILGQGFTTATSVIFGSASASFTIVSDTYLTAVVPPDGITGFVTVTTSAGPLASSKTFKLVPAITGFNPPSGPAGTQVTITGVGLNGATKVTIGAAYAAFTVNSGSQITATVSARAKTGEKIAVTTAGGMATSNGTFTVP